MNYSMAQSQAFTIKCIIPYTDIKKYNGLLVHNVGKQLDALIEKHDIPVKCGQENNVQVHFTGLWPISFTQDRNTISLKAIDVERLSTLDGEIWIEGSVFKSATTQILL